MAELELNPETKQEIQNLLTEQGGLLRDYMDYMSDIVFDLALISQQTRDPSINEVLSKHTNRIAFIRNTFKTLLKSAK